MTRSMTRRLLAGALALSAMGAVAVLEAGSAPAEAAPSVSPFAGTYDWSGWPAPITISDGGRITSSYSGFSRTKGSINGRVDDQGSYAFTVSETWYDAPERGKGTWYSWSSKYAGDMAPDADGNLVGIADTGGSFLWTRR